jgi:hypothetical protein
MAHANARQWQRFSYQADVQLRWAAAHSADQRAPSSRCVDLSRGGIQIEQIETDEAPDVGAAVSCQLACAGAWTALPGRVRWCKPPLGPASGARLGIEFDELSADQQASVRVVLASIQEAGQPVRLRLAALREPLQALAIPTERGVRLRAALPLFTAGSDLDFELADPPTRFSGRVVSTQLRAVPGDDALQVEVMVEERAPRSRRYTMYQTGQAARALTTARRTTLSGSVQPSAAQAASLLPTPQPMQPLVAVVAGTPLVAVVAETPTIARAGLTPSAADVAARQRQLPPSAAEEALPAIPKSRGLRVTASLLGLVVLAGLLNELLQLRSPSAPARVSSATHARKPDVPARLPTAAAVGATTGAVADALAAVASPVPAPPSAAQGEPRGEQQSDVKKNDIVSDVGADPTLKVSGDTSEVFVPTRGSLEGLRAAIWSEPLALVIDLPEAKLALTHSRYALKAGGIKLLSVGEARGVTQLRLFLDELLARYSTEATSGGLLIRLKRDLRPLP